MPVINTGRRNMHACLSHGIAFALSIHCRKGSFGQAPSAQKVRLSFFVFCFYVFAATMFLRPLNGTPYRLVSLAGLRVEPAESISTAPPGYEECLFRVHQTFS